MALIEPCTEMAHAAPSGCDRCGKLLKGKQRRWCGNACSQWWLTNHQWTAARRRCRAQAKVRGQRLWRCAASPGCMTDRPEVNHIVPILGRHGSNGCHHHQEGLQVLCHAHHLQATAAQRAAGAFK